MVTAGSAGITNAIAKVMIEVPISTAMPNTIRRTRKANMVTPRWCRARSIHGAVLLRRDRDGAGRQGLPALPGDTGLLRQGSLARHGSSPPIRATWAERDSSALLVAEHASTPGMPQAMSSRSSRGTAQRRNCETDEVAYRCGAQRDEQEPQPRTPARSARQPSFEVSNAEQNDRGRGERGNQGGSSRGNKNVRKQREQGADRKRDAHYQPVDRGIGQHASAQSKDLYLGGGQQRLGRAA